MHGTKNNQSQFISIKEPTGGYQICNISQMLIFVGYVKVREFLYTRVVLWVNIILYHIDV